MTILKLAALVGPALGFVAGYCFARWRNVGRDIALISAMQTRLARLEAETEEVIINMQSQVNGYREELRRIMIRHKPPANR